MDKRLRAEGIVVVASFTRVSVGHGSQIVQGCGRVWARGPIQANGRILLRVVSPGGPNGGTPDIQAAVLPEPFSGSWTYHRGHYTRHKSFIETRLTAMVAGAVAVFFRLHLRIMKGHHARL